MKLTMTFEHPTELHFDHQGNGLGLAAKDRVVWMPIYGEHLLVVAAHTMKELSLPTNWTVS